MRDFQVGLRSPHRQILYPHAAMPARFQVVCPALPEVPLIFAPSPALTLASGDFVEDSSWQSLGGNTIIAGEWTGPVVTHPDYPLATWTTSIEIQRHWMAVPTAGPRYWQVQLTLCTSYFPVANPCRFFFWNTYIVAEAVPPEFVLYGDNDLNKKAELAPKYWV